MIIIFTIILGIYVVHMVKVMARMKSNSCMELFFFFSFFSPVIAL